MLPSGVTAPSPPPQIAEFNEDVEANEAGESNETVRLVQYMETGVEPPRDVSVDISFA